MRTKREAWLAAMVLSVLVFALGQANAGVALTPQRNEQRAITSADIQRLQDGVYTAESDLSRLRSRDPELANQLQGELDNLRDEVTYLKVKLRKEGGVDPTEYADVRDRLQDLRAQARGEAPPAAQETAPPPRPGTQPPPPPPPAPERPPERGAEPPAPVQPAARRPNEVPVDTELDVRLRSDLNSGTAQVEDRFTANTTVDLENNGRVLIPAGSVVRGVVTSVTKAGRLERTGKLTLAFDQITINGRSYPIHATVTQALESRGYRGDVGKIATGAGIGAIIGGIIGGAKGALAGILIGGGGTVAATEGQDVDLPPGTVLRLRFDAPLVVR